MTQKKIPEVTLAFWIMKICATTLGETAGDLVSMTMSVGYAKSSLGFGTVGSSAILAAALVVLVVHGTREHGCRRSA